MIKMRNIIQIWLEAKKVIKVVNFKPHLKFINNNWKRIK